MSTIGCGGLTSLHYDDMMMNMIRTTVSLPEELHEEIRLLAFKNRISFSDAMLSKINGKKNYKKSQKSLDKDIERTIKFFRKIANTGTKIDAEKAVREEREERTDKLSKYL